MKLYRLEPQEDKDKDAGLAPVLQEMERPEPGPDEVLIKVQAASLNYRDLLMRKGQSGSGGGGSIIPLSDGAGVVEAVGKDVSRFKEGDRVAGCFFCGWDDGPFDMKYHKAALGGSLDGMLAEYVTLPEVGVVEAPPHLSAEEAACLPCAGLTAWTALFERAQLKPGETVLALGTGGVSIFALQFAVAAAAKVIITSSKDEKLHRARELGADYGINYRTHPEWDREVWTQTEKRGVEHILEVGGPGTFPRSLNSIAAGGNLALIGVLTGKGAPDSSLFPLVTRCVNLHGIYVGHRAAFSRMNAFLEEHEIHPVIDRTFEFEDAPAAYEYLESGQHFGKVVIRVG